MESIKINVNKQPDGYTFSIGPTVRQLVKDLYPDSYPANLIFVNYDMKSGFEHHYQKLENYIYPALLGIKNKRDLNDKISEILFIDTQTNNVLHTHKIIS